MEQSLVGLIMERETRVRMVPDGPRKIAEPMIPPSQTRAQGGRT
jgi:hypothetical protein